MGFGSRAWMGLCASLLVSLGAPSSSDAQEVPSHPPSAPPPQAARTKPPAAHLKATPKAAPAKGAPAKPGRAKEPAARPPKLPPKALPSEEDAGAAPGEGDAADANTKKGSVTVGRTKGALSPKASPSHAKSPAPVRKPGPSPRHAAPKERPAARLAESEAGKPDERARRALTGRRPEASEADPHESAELLRLRELDHTLFPPAQGGANAPWPTNLGARGDGPTVDDSGLPKATASDTASPPSAAPAAPANDLTWLTALEQPDLPVRFDPAVVRYLTYYRDNPRGRSLLAGWVKRSGRYGSAIRKVLRDNKLPEDLLWLALVESGFDSTIHSHAGAAGLWQFVPSTGRIYGLTVTRRVDERLDPERATQAAVRHLSDLHTRFGSWELAFAAYNMGYGGLLSAIRKYNTNDYWELRRLEAGLPYETALYVPKILSIAIAAKNCKVFGCDGVDLDPPEPFGDTVVDKVSVAPGVSLQDVADAIGSRPEMVAALNPHVLGTRLPPIDDGATTRETWTVYVPRGKGARAVHVVPKDAPPRQLMTYRVRWGEPMEHIAARFGTSVAYLEKLNDLDPGESPRAGTTLFLPAHLRPRQDSEAAAEVAGAHGLGKSGKPILVVPSQEFAYPDRRRVFYQGVLGDSLEDVAEVCGVTGAELRRWNHLDAHAALQDGMTLQVFVPKDTHPRDVLLLDAAQVESMPVESHAFFAHFVGQLGRERLEIEAQRGDTWSTLAGRHGMSVGMLERINQKSRSSKLEPGEKVVVYARRKPVAPVALEDDADDDVDDDLDAGDDPEETQAGG